MIRKAGDAHLPEEQRNLNTALVTAALRRDRSEVASLKGEGADIEAPRPLGFSPLSEYAAFGTVAECKALLEAGASPDGSAEMSDAGKSPVFSAVLLAKNKDDRAEVIGLLAEAGADFNGAANTAPMPLTGDTALHVAARIGDEACGRALLDGGASPQAHNALGESPAECARGYGHGAFAEMLDAHLAEAHAEHDPSMDWHFEHQAGPATTAGVASGPGM